MLLVTYEAAGITDYGVDIFDRLKAAIDGPPRIVIVKIPPDS